MLICLFPDDDPDFWRVRELSMISQYAGFPTECIFYEAFSGREEAVVSTRAIEQMKKFKGGPVSIGQYACFPGPAYAPS